MMVLVGILAILALILVVVLMLETLVRVEMLITILGLMGAVLEREVVRVEMLILGESVILRVVELRSVWKGFVYN